MKFDPQNLPKLSPVQVAQLFGPHVTPELVLKEIRAGKLRAHRVGARKFLVSERALADYLSETATAK